MTIGIQMPAWNSAKWLDEAIGCVLKQTYQDWRLVIVDDGSDDGTYPIAMQAAHKDPRIHVENMMHKGCPEARNRCLDILLAQPDIEYIACMDSDDRDEPWRIAAQLAHLQSEKADVCTCRYDWIDPNGKFLRKMHGVCNASMLVRREWFERIKYPTVHWAGSDGRWVELAKAAGVKWTILDAWGYHQRRHPNEISIRKRIQK